MTTRVQYATGAHSGAIAMLRSLRNAAYIQQNAHLQISSYFSTAPFNANRCGFT